MPLRAMKSSSLPRCSTTPLENGQCDKMNWCGTHKPLLTSRIVSLQKSMGRRTSELLVNRRLLISVWWPWRLSRFQCRRNRRTNSTNSSCLRVWEPSTDTTQSELDVIKLEEDIGLGAQKRSTKRTVHAPLQLQRAIGCSCGRRRWQLLSSSTRPKRFVELVKLRRGHGAQSYWYVQ